MTNTNDPQPSSMQPQRQPFAIWNQALGIWQTTQPDLFGQWEPYWHPWPSSGWMRHGAVYPLPPSARSTPGFASSSSPGLDQATVVPVPVLFRTPLASDAIRGNEPIWHVKARRGTITLSHQLIEMSQYGPNGRPDDPQTLFALTLDFLTHDTPPTPGSETSAT